MSTATAPMSLRTARAVATEMIEALRPYCHRVEVAGSIRRGRAWVNDIEIVAIPKVTVPPASVDLFGREVAKPKPVRDPGFIMVVDSLADRIVKGSITEGRYVQLYTGDGTPVPTREEADLFALLGMNVPRPHERELTAKGLSPWIK